MKIKGFLKDVTGAMRVTNARRNLIAEASSANLYKDPIRELCAELHPEATHVRVTRVEDASPTARTFTFEAVDGEVLPPFQAGQYVSFELEIGETLTTRPFSISSAPFQARTGEDPFFQVTIRTSRPGEGFVAPWFYENVKVGDEFTCHVPFGFFFWEPLRDAEHVVALAGGSGITPFHSMAAEIAHGTLDCDLTILYGSVSPDDVILGDDLAEIAAGCDRVKMVNVFSGKDVELPEGCIPCGMIDIPEDLANAMEARGYAPGEERTRYKVLKMEGRDYILLIVCAALLACMIWLSMRS
jgi:ferredoxin-NADP reductase